jgi:sugar phosphate isomerase/epimerase
MNRRTWLRTAACYSIGGVATSSILSSSARAIEPIPRNGQPKFKFSLAAYSYRDLLTGKSPQLTLADFIDDCAKFGLEGTELTSYYFPPQPTRDYLNELARHRFRHRRRKRLLPSTGQGARRPNRERQALDRACRDSRRAGHSHLLRQRQARPIARRRPQARRRRHGTVLRFHSADIYGDLAKLAPYSVNVQVKVVIAPKGGKREPTDFGKLAAILRDAGYRGYVVLEFEEKGDPRTECPKYLDQLRTAFA